MALSGNGSTWWLSVNSGTSSPSRSGPPTITSDSRMMPAPSIASRNAASASSVMTRGRTSTTSMPRGLERPAVETGTFDHDAIVVLQIGSDLRRAVLREVCGRRTDHALQVCDLALDKRPLRQVAGAHGDIGLRLDQIDQTVGDRQLDVDFRIAGEEIGQRRRQLMQAEGGAGIDMQPPARRAAHARHLGFRLVDVGDDTPRARQEGLAFRRQRQPAGRALQQAGAQPVLQPRHQLGDRRGGEP